MPILWSKIDDENPRWVPAALGGECMLPAGSAALCPVWADGVAGWLLFASAAVRVNGDPLWLGVRALADRDEICLTSGERFFYSTESLPRIEPFDGPAGTVCPRCELVLAPGVPSVRCRCSVAYHMSEAQQLPCYQYGNECVVCRALTSLDADYRWRPEDL